jgi:site-specific recombinase XerD
MTRDFKLSVNKELADRYERWMVAQGYAPATRYYYNGAVRSFLEFLGDKLATKTTQVEVQEYVAWAAAAGCPTYKLRERLYALRIFFDFLCLGGLMPWSPPRLVHLKRMKGRLPKILSKRDVRKVLSTAKSPRERVLVEILYGTGIRCGELLSLKVRNIDFLNRRFLVHGKAGDRVVLFSTRVRQAVKRYLRGRKQGYLFAIRKAVSLPRVFSAAGGGWCCRYVSHSANGRQLHQKSITIPAKARLKYDEARRLLLRRVRADRYSRPIGSSALSDNSIQRDLRSLSARSGVEVTARILRHTFATHMMDNGADLRAVRDLMGHKSLRSTTIYTHVSKGSLRRAYDWFHPNPS